MRFLNQAKYYTGMMVCLVMIMVATVSSVEAVSGSDILNRVDTAMRIDQRVMTQTMVLRNAKGQERTRVVQLWNKRYDGQDHMLLRFLEPANVKGTAFLIEGEDMWLYLPALRRVRRIAGHARNGNFMGSDFTYNDMEQFGAAGFGDDYTAEYLETENRASGNIDVLVLTPKAEGSYTQLKMWVDRKTLLPRKIHYYDDGTLLKTLTTAGLQKVEGRWTATQITMHDELRDTWTTLDVNQVSFNAAIDASVFSVRNLERGN